MKESKKVFIEHMEALFGILGHLVRYISQFTNN
jgi:hypothetical protein